MYDSDSSYFETTYSQDERIEAGLRKKRLKELENQRKIDENREALFARLFTKATLPIFSLSAVKILKFTSLKIRFSFEPSKVVRHVSKKVIFYCCLKYYKDYQRWHVKRDSFPVSYKQRIYRLFFDDKYFTVGDNKLVEVILAVDKILREWAKCEENFRIDKFMRYQNGELEYFELDTDDEELFLSEKEKIELHEKRKEVLRRMLPPNERRPKRRRIVKPKSA